MALIVGLGAATWMYFQQVRLREQAERAEKRESELRRQAEAKEQINQAAIYVSQANFEDANQILDRVKILPTRLSYDGVVAYRRVGDWLALQQRWAEAADRFYPLMDIDKLEGWQVVTLDYQACDVLLAECGDRRRYDDFCKAAIARFQTSDNGDMAGRILKTCLLFPSDRPLLEQVAPMARVAAVGYHPEPQERFQSWPVLYLTLWEYRRGNLAAVDAWCQRAAAHTGESEVWAATMRIIQAMADHKRGKSEKAAEELARACQTIEPYFGATRLPTFRQGYWYDWLFARILLREAAEMVEAKATSGPGSTALQ